MRTFVTIWFGQLISMLGSGLTGFALSVYIYQETGSTTQLGLSVLSAMLPNLLMSLATALAYLYPGVRLLEDELPDCGPAAATPAAA